MVAHLLAFVRLLLLPLPHPRIRLGGRAVRPSVRAQWLAARRQLLHSTQVAGWVAVLEIALSVSLALWLSVSLSLAHCCCPSNPSTTATARSIVSCRSARSRARARSPRPGVSTRSHLLCCIWALLRKPRSRALVHCVCLSVSVSVCLSVSGSVYRALPAPLGANLASLPVVMKDVPTRSDVPDPNVIVRGRRGGGAPLRLNSCVATCSVQSIRVCMQSCMQTSIIIYIRNRHADIADLLCGGGTTRALLARMNATQSHRRSTS